MQLTITELDPADEPSVEAVQALRVAVEAADLPDFPAPCPYDFRADLANQSPRRRRDRFVARADGQVAGLLTVHMPLTDNLENAELTLAIHPDHRRRGVGRALHAHAVEHVRSLGRKRMLCHTVESWPGGPPRGTAGRAFATAMGAKAALDEVRRRLDLATVEAAALEAMRDEAAKRADGYQLITWRDYTPDEYAADAGYLDGRLMADAPIGELTVEPEKVDVARLREREDLYRAARISLYNTGAVHRASGRLVALTTLARYHSSPWHAFQWITLVDPEHRGHRLGALVKVDNLRFAQQHEPELRRIDTWNAASNAYMISINEAMGFRPVDSWVNWQQDV